MNSVSGEGKEQDRGWAQQRPPTFTFLVVEMEQNLVALWAHPNEACGPYVAGPHICVLGPKASQAEGPSLGLSAGENSLPGVWGLAGPVPVQGRGCLDVGDRAEIPHAGPWMSGL